MRKCVGLETVPVNQQEFGRGGQRIDGTVHREVGGLEDVQPLNFLHGSPAYRPGCSLPLDVFAENMAQPFLEVLAVVQTEGHPMGTCRARNDRGSRHGPRQTSPSGLIDTGFQSA